MTRMHNPPHPGEALREDVLPALGLTVTDAAAQLGVTRAALSHVLNGRAAISPEMALRLEGWLGVENGGSADAWIAQQDAYGLWKARAAGAPVATLGISSIQEGWTGEPGFVRSAATTALGVRAGNAATDVVNVGTSVAGLIKSTVRPGTWSLFRNISSDYVPAWQTMTRTGLTTEIGGTVMGAVDGVCRQLGGQ